MIIRVITVVEDISEENFCSFYEVEIPPGRSIVHALQDSGHDAGQSAARKWVSGINRPTDT